MIQVKVIEGDCLSVLASIFLGDGERWPEIKRDNANQIATMQRLHGFQPNTNAIFPGMILRIDIAGVDALSDRAARRLIATALRL